LRFPGGGVGVGVGEGVGVSVGVGVGVSVSIDAGDTLDDDVDSVGGVGVEERCHGACPAPSLYTPAGPRSLPLSTP
jgi:hypothetical protein